MNLKEKIQNDLKQALKAKEAVTVSTLRLLISAITNAEIQKKKKAEGLADEEIIEVISRQVKEREEAATQYTKGGREALAQKEAREKEILKKYLPKALSEEELKLVIKKAIRETGATRTTEAGKVMAKVMPALKGRASGAKVSQLVGKMLNSENKPRPCGTG